MVLPGQNKICSNVSATFVTRQHTIPTGYFSCLPPLAERLRPGSDVGYPHRELLPPDPLFPQPFDEAQDVIHQVPATRLRIPPLLPVGEVGSPSLLPRRLSGRMVPGRHFDVVQNIEGCPRCGRMTKLAFTLNRPHDFRPGFVVPFEPMQGGGDVVSPQPFSSQISQCNCNISCLPVKGQRLFRPAQVIIVKIPQLV